jgi:hypothetical protein
MLLASYRARAALAVGAALAVLAAAGCGGNGQGQSAPVPPVESSPGLAKTVPANTDSARTTLPGAPANRVPQLKAAAQSNVPGSVRAKGASPGGGVTAAPGVENPGTTGSTAGSNATETTTS